jgi:lysophospholipase L1-like esterase
VVPATSSRAGFPSSAPSSGDRARLIRVVTVACGLSGGVTAAAYADNYVALGDSYSSGTGTRDYSLNSGCQRGPYAYPALIKADRPGTNLTFVACSGATTGDVLANQVPSLNASTNVVTITIGGNDAGFSSVITACAAPLV